MTLEDLKNNFQTKTHFSPFCLKTNMPPLSISKLTSEILTGSERDKLKTPTEGDASITINYKNKGASLTSFEELNDGEI
jgi:hypothetical protein